MFLPLLLGALAVALVLCACAPVALVAILNLLVLCLVFTALLVAVSRVDGRRSPAFGPMGGRAQAAYTALRRRPFVVFALIGACALCACTTAELGESSSLIADLSALLSTAEGNGSVPTKIAADINEAISGIDALATGTSASVASGSSTEATVVSALESAVTTVAADLPSNATVQTDAAQAEQLLGEVNTTSTETGAQQAEAAVGTFLVDYLAAKGPAGAAVGAAPSAYETLIEDARTHIAHLQG